MFSFLYCSKIWGKPHEWIFKDESVKRLNLIPPSFVYCSCRDCLDCWLNCLNYNRRLVFLMKQLFFYSRIGRSKLTRSFVWLLTGGIDMLLLSEENLEELNVYPIFWVFLPYYGKLGLLIIIKCWLNKLSMFRGNSSY